MAHFAKPWFRKNRGWFVTIGSRQVPLGADKDQAFQRYHQLMAAGPAPSKAPSDSVLAVLERYLEWCSEHRAEETYEWYRWRLQLFIESIDKRMLASQLKHFHIDEWLLKRPDWSPGTKHGMARAVMRACCAILPFTEIGPWGPKNSTKSPAPFVSYYVSTSQASGNRSTAGSGSRFTRFPFKTSLIACRSDLACGDIRSRQGPD